MSDACPYCHRPYVTTSGDYPLPVSEFHTRCLGCGIPTGNNVLLEGYCEICRQKLDRDGHLFVKGKGFIKHHPP